MIRFSRSSRAAAHVLAVLASFTLAEPALRAAAPALDFDPGVELAKYTWNEADGRYEGPDGSLVLVFSEKMPVAQARKELKNRLTQLELLFAPHGAAYPGMLTKDASCAQSARLPSKVSETPDSFYWFSELPATQALVYGSCGSIEEPFWSQKLMLYCKAEGSLHDVRFFRKKGGEKNLSGRPLAHCKPIL